MAYIDQSRRASPASMAAVVGVHGAIALLLLTGLTMSGAIAPSDDILTGFDLKDPPKPPPPPPEAVDEPVVSTPRTLPYVPKPAIDLDPSPPIETTREFPTLGPIIVDPGPRPAPDPLPTIEPRGYDPVPAKPRNDPARWLSTSDYKSSWVRQELAGTARFRLQIAATGKVTGCTVAGSTGHEALDRATCTLITRRAKFEPARGKQGEPVASSYTSAVVWQLPE